MKQTGNIFICTFDYFEKGRHLYTFENRCVEDPELKLQDETQKIILNTKGYLEDVSQEVRDFLHYIEHTTEEAARKSSGTLVKNIQKKVEQVKRNRGLEVEFMTFEEKLKEEKKYSWEEGHEEGHKEGLEEGLKEGQKKGLAEKAISTAKKLKMAGVDIETIADSVGLSEEEIRAL